MNAKVVNRAQPLPQQFGKHRVNRRGQNGTKKLRVWQKTRGCAAIERSGNTDDLSGRLDPEAHPCVLPFSSWLLQRSSWQLAAEARATVMTQRAHRLR